MWPSPTYLQAQNGFDIFKWLKQSKRQEYSVI